MTIDATMRNAVLDSLIKGLHDRYVFPKVADELDRNLRGRQKRGEFDRITSAETFADTLSVILRQVGKDRHFRVGYREEAIPAFSDDGPPPEAEVKRFEEMARRLNYGYDTVRRLAGNVGYVEIRSFQFTGPEAGAAATAAMNFVANTDALIIDVRRNGGGSPEMVQLVTTYLFAGDGERQHLNDLIFRDGGTEHEVQFYTLPWVPGPRNGGVRCTCSPAAAPDRPPRSSPTTSRISSAPRSWATPPAAPPIPAASCGSAITSSRSSRTAAPAIPSPRPTGKAWA